MTTMANIRHYDFAVIGSGPAGQGAAIHAARRGYRVAMIEREGKTGGLDIHQGALPSRRLGESARQIQQLRRQAKQMAIKIPQVVSMASLLNRHEAISDNYHQCVKQHTLHSNIDLISGHAQFVDSHTLRVCQSQCADQQINARNIIIATGSRPAWQQLQADPPYLVDSNSLWSITQLPQSLIVYGKSIPACEFATIFAALGTQVTWLGEDDKPLTFVDSDISAHFLRNFLAMGGHYLGNRQIVEAWREQRSVRAQLNNGELLSAERLLNCQHRLGNTEQLQLGIAGLRLADNGFIAVDLFGRTNIPHIYATGDVIGPPGLATDAMEQGRRSSWHAQEKSIGERFDYAPSAIYGLPEVAYVGLNEVQARQQHDNIWVGCCYLDQLARGQISGTQEGGLLKLIVDAHSQRLLGTQIIGQGATELIHIAQMALLSEQTINCFLDHAFNFPTLAEAYRLAALDIAEQMQSLNVQRVNRQSWKLRT